MTGKILLCTVGGSHEPIVKAIRSLSPDYVCFFCTDIDTTTGKVGSKKQIIGKGNVIKVQLYDDQPSLPNIPTQVNLQEENYHICTVFADDLDAAFLTMTNEAKKLAEKFPGAMIYADYTGGTKTMSAALVCAALESPDMKLQLVTGSRSNLTHISSGTETVFGASVSRLRFKREIAVHLRTWKQFAYHEAAEGLSTIRLDVSSLDHQHLQIARVLSQAFASWNNFDHAAALQFLKQVDATRIYQVWPWMLRDINILTNRDNRRWDVLCIYDLWRNAERCAYQGRFDDAVARTYRMIEWTAQWQLCSKCKIDTANVPPNKLPSDLIVHPDRYGKIKIGLWAAWQVFAFNSESRLSHSLSEELWDFLNIRNYSILAHGNNPVQKSDWEKIKDWMVCKFLPVLEGLAREVDIHQPLKQLPQELPLEILRPGG